MCGSDIMEWLADPDPTRFPYDAVVDAYLRVGKHFVSDDILKALGRARDRLDERPDGGGPEWSLLRRLLVTALDKWDNRYDYPTYIAVSVLDLPTIDEPPAAVGAATARRDRLVVQLVADALGFELAVADGRTALLPQLRPAAPTVAKRYRLAMRAAVPALRRLGFGGEITATRPEQAARQLCAVVDRETTGAERRVLRLSMLPVHVCHDEYLFIRVLQLFETTLAMMAVRLQAARQALVSGDRGDGAAAAEHLRVSGRALRESAPLFSLLATMQVEAFHTFRTYTEGASAIQSRNYKMVESLCRRPDDDRLASMAYRSVPEVRERVLNGQPDLDSAVTAALASGRLSAEEQAALSEAMGQFTGALLSWRRTHYRLAVRMLGERPGTGYTEGTPYLKAVRFIPVFQNAMANENGMAQATMMAKESGEDE